MRFDDCTSPETKIKYMTDGMLEREILLDPNLTITLFIMLMKLTNELSLPMSSLAS